ncbi:MAG: hypothetical protein R2702_11815 [Acidimicrobiales bacterium]
MIHVIRSEWIKLRTVRSTIITLFAAGAIVVLVAVLSVNNINGNQDTRCVAASSPDATATTVPDDGSFGVESCGPDATLVAQPTPAHLSDVTAGVTIAVFVFGALGVQVIGQEYRFNTIRPTFTAVPDRRRVLLAKLVVMAASTAVVALLMTLVCWAIGSALADSWVVDGTDHRLLWAIPLFAALWTIGGIGVGAIVRQPIAGILVLLGWAFIAEQIIGSVVDGSARWLPFLNGIQMTTRVEAGQQDVRPLLEGGIYFAIVCALLFVVGTILADRRDA